MYISSTDAYFEYFILYFHIYILYILTPFHKCIKIHNLKLHNRLANFETINISISENDTGNVASQIQIQNFFLLRYKTVVFESRRYRSIDFPCF